ncbi:unnamed protein product, partial [marine sediment metagenome]
MNFPSIQVDEVGDFGSSARVKSVTIVAFVPSENR